MNKLLVVLLLMLSFSSHAFDWNKCKKDISKARRDYGLYMSSVSSTSSTGEFTTSTGKCAAIGLNSREDKIKHFLAHNQEHLEVEWASGVEGEYTIAYKQLLNQ